jgi:3-oxoadipate enol-lactonase
MNSTLSHNDGQIQYEITGSGEPIVFIHGHTLDRRMWRPQVKYFSKNYQVIAYDVRGFGKSSLPTHFYSHDDDLYALLQHLDIARAHIAGLSLGGRIAVNFTLSHPEAVRSLTLIDSALDGYASTVDWRVDAKCAGIQGAKENWLNHDLFAATMQNPDAIGALREIVDDYSGWHWLHKDLQEPVSSHAKTRLDEISVPTLVLVGEKDLSYFHNIADVLADKIAGAHRSTIAAAGHMANLESPDAVNELLSSFLLNIR